jgi:hypothetical protein
MISAITVYIGQVNVLRDAIIKKKKKKKKKKKRFPEGNLQREGGVALGQLQDWSGE